MPRIIHEALYLNIQVQSSPISLAAITRTVSHADSILWLLLNEKFKKVLILEIYAGDIIMQTKAYFKLKCLISLTPFS